MQFVVKNGIKHVVRSVMWRGRCGALHVFQRGHVVGESLNLFVLGAHNSHGDLQVDTLADVAYLLKHRHRGSKVLAVGDWNVDQLPVLDGDPFSHVTNRDSRHFDERLRLQCLADQFHLELEIPRVVCSVPGGPFAHQCGIAPITRVPVGCAVLTDLPSTLDDGLATPNLVRDVQLHWEGAPADHAINVFTLAPCSIVRTSVKTSWKCSDETGCLRWLAECAPESFTDVEAFHTFLLKMQRSWADERTCKERRDARLPPQLRILYSQIAGCTRECDRRLLQRNAWQLRKQWCQEWRDSILSENVKRARVLQRSKKLHKLEKLVLSEASGELTGQQSTDKSQWAIEICSQFANKWGSHDTEEGEEESSERSLGA